MLAPVRNDAQGVMNINHLVHMRYREELTALAKRDRYKKIAKPFGPEGIIYGDKVINIVNHRRPAWPDGGRNYIANGEIGIACGAFGKQHDFLNVEFSSQTDYSYLIQQTNSGKIRISSLNWHMPLLFINLREANLIQLYL